MGNQQLIQNVTAGLLPEVEISRKQREVAFLDGRFRAETTFKRHNYQYFKVRGA